MPIEIALVQSLRRELNDLRRQRNAAIAVWKQETEALAQAGQLVTDTLVAQANLQAVAQLVQQKIHQQIAKVVSKCLTAVFKQPYELQIEFERKRGKTEAEFIYLRDGQRVRPRQTSGGVLHVAALALRLSSLILTMPPTRRFIALDEPFQGLSETNLQKMGVLIETLAAELNVQFLLVTHNPELRIGKVIEL